MNIAELVVTLVGGLFGSGSIVALLLVRGQQRKLRASAEESKADYAKVISGTAISLLAPMREQIESLSAQLRAANAEIIALRRSMAELTSEMGKGHDEEQRRRERR